MDEKCVLVAEEFVAMRVGFEREAEERDTVYKKAREIGHQITVAKHAITTGAPASASAPLLADISMQLSAVLAAKDAAGSTQQNGALSGAIERHAAASMLAHFLTTGTLLSFARLQAPCRTTRDEYLVAVMDFAGDLGAYSLGRATKRDIRSILACRNIVDELNTHLMTFDFRNGPLRRNYDKIKYTLKRIEDMLYELSLTSAGEEPANKALLAMPRLATAGTKRKRGSTAAATAAEAAPVRGCQRR